MRSQHGEAKQIMLHQQQLRYKIEYESNGGDRVVPFETYLQKSSLLTDVTNKDTQSYKPVMSRMQLPASNPKYELGTWEKRIPNIQKHHITSKSPSLLNPTNSFRIQSFETGKRQRSLLNVMKDSRIAVQIPNNCARSQTTCFESIAGRRLKSKTQVLQATTSNNGANPDSNETEDRQVLSTLLRMSSWSFQSLRQ